MRSVIMGSSNKKGRKVPKGKEPVMIVSICAAALLAVAVFALAGCIAAVTL
nr:hypothetical protein [uncultured Adlercreutzia sp.]